MDPFLALLLTCLKAGAFSVGGAAGMFSVLAHGLVEQGGWVGLEEFLYAVTLGQATPGPVVLGMSWLGIQKAGIGGGLLIALCLILPGIFWLLLITKVSQSLRHLDWVRHFLSGVRVAVPGLLLALALQLVPAGGFSSFWILLAPLTLWLVLRWRVEPALLLLAAVLAAGWVA